jgi:hypothetical protein
MAMIGNGRARCYDKNWKNSVLLLSEIWILSGKASIAMKPAEIISIFFNFLL